MAKVFGYVELSVEGMKNIGVVNKGPFPIIDLDHQFGVEILDHKKIGHWIMKGQYNQLEENTIHKGQYEQACHVMKHGNDIQTTMEIVKGLVGVQGQNGNWDVSPAMCGMFNGMELILAILEGREPAYRTVEQKSDQTTYDELLAQADKEEESALALFEGGDKLNSLYRDGYASGIRKAVETIQER